MATPNAITRAGPAARKEYESLQKRAASSREKLRESTSTTTLIMEGSMIGLGAFSAGFLDKTVLPRVGSMPGSVVLGTISVVAGAKMGGASGRSLVLAGNGMVAPTLYAYGQIASDSLNKAVADAQAALASG